MSLHIGNCLTMAEVVPETRFSQEQLEQIRDCVLYNINRTMAYAVTNYVDWIVYTCIRYLEGGGIDDLSHIEKAIIFPLDIPFELQKKVTDDIYFIIRPILINAAIYKSANIEPKFDVNSAVNFMVENCKDVNWNTLQRAMKTLESKFKND